MHDRQHELTEDTLGDLDHALGTELLPSSDFVLENKTDFTYRNVTNSKLPVKIRKGWWVTKSPWRSGDFGQTREGTIWIVDDTPRRFLSFDKERSIPLFEEHDAEYEIPGEHGELFEHVEEAEVPDAIPKFHASVVKTQRGAKKSGKLRYLSSSATDVADLLAEKTDDTYTVVQLEGVRLHQTSTDVFVLESNENKYRLIRTKKRWKLRKFKAHPGRWFVRSQETGGDEAVAVGGWSYFGVVIDAPLHRSQTQSVNEILTSLKAKHKGMKALRLHVSSLEAVESPYSRWYEERDGRVREYLASIPAKSGEGTLDRIHEKFLELGYGYEYADDRIGSYVDLWVHPAIEYFNRGKGVLAQRYFHVRGRQSTTAKYDYILIWGRVGNTSTAGYFRPRVTDTREPTEAETSLLAALSGVTFTGGADHALT